MHHATESATLEAALLLLHESAEVKQYHERLKQKHNKGKALGILSHRLGRSIYFVSAS